MPDTAGRGVPWKVIPGKRQKPGAQIGGIWVVMQAWPIASLYTLAQLGPEGAKVTEGPAGGWEVIARPRDVGITEWTGRPNYAMTLDLLYDGWITHVIRPNLRNWFIGTPKIPVNFRFNDRQTPRGIWIEGMIAGLEALGDRQRDQRTPPSLRIYGGVPHTELRWVITKLDWGDTIRDIVTGRRMRQQVTVSLLEYVQPMELAKLPRAKADPKKKGKQKKPAKPKPATKKKGK